jgi:hypothetical protein
MFINIYKDWSNEVHVESLTSMGAIHEYGSRFYVIFFICYALVSFLFWPNSFIG